MYTQKGGFLSGIDQFDAECFGITPREAASLDPQQRLLLEVAYGSLVNAGLRPENLQGSDMGVFVGVSTSDYSQLELWSGDVDRINAYSLTGTTLSINAGRLSYYFGLTGPSMAVDTACSSSLSAIHAACQSIRLRECTTALAAGANVILRPELTVNHCRLGVLSPDGRCKAFDASADGFVRSEGCAVLVLKLLSQAVAEGDRILAVMRGSAVNQDGRSDGLTAPSETAQTAVIRQAWSNAGIEPNQVNYVEAHGTGTALGDPVEICALGAALGSQEVPIQVGSVKSNIGHLEAAAGIAGVVKVILALRNETIPATLHLSQVNPAIAEKGFPIEFPTSSVSWKRGERPRIAGVTSFGLAGTNVHLVLEEAPKGCEFFPDGEPAQPVFRRKRYWVRPVPAAKGTKTHKELSTASLRSCVHPLLDFELRLEGQERVFQLLLDDEMPTYLGQHRFFGRPVIPATVFIQMAMATSGEMNVEIDELRISAPLILGGGDRLLQISVRPENGPAPFRIASLDPVAENDSWTVHARGKLCERKAGDPIVSSVNASLDELRSKLTDSISGPQFYSQLDSSGMNYGDCYQGLEQAWIGDGEVLGHIRKPTCLLDESRDYGMHPAVLDACLQVVHALANHISDEESDNSERENSVLLPLYVGRAVVGKASGNEFWSHACVRPGSESGNENVIDVTVFDESGRPLALAEDILVRRVNADWESFAPAISSNGTPAGGRDDASQSEASATGISLHSTGDMVTRLRRIVAEGMFLESEEDVSIDQPLREVGMDSIMATELMIELEEMVGERLPETFLFEYETIEAIADFVVKETNRRGQVLPSVI